MENKETTCCPPQEKHTIKETLQDSLERLECLFKAYQDDSEFNYQLNNENSPWNKLKETVRNLYNASTVFFKRIDNIGVYRAWDDVSLTWTLEFNFPWRSAYSNPCITLSEKEYLLFKKLGVNVEDHCGRIDDDGISDRYKEAPITYAGI